MSKSKTDKREIDKYWNDTSKLSTLEGCVDMACEGDRQAIKILMGSFVMKVENGRQPAPEIMSWFANSFVRILSNEKTDVVSIFQPGVRGRRPLDSVDREKRLGIAQYIIQNSSPDDLGSLKVAVEGDEKLGGFEGATTKFRISRETAYTIYYGYRINKT